MRILHLASRDQRGGAARATAHLHVGLRRLGAGSQLFVRERFGDDPSVTAFVPSVDPDARRARQARADELAREFEAYGATRPAGYERFSDDRSDVAAELLPQLPPADVTVLHWVSGFVDYAAVVPVLARRAPLVWMLHDLNPFTGGCHYDAGCDRYAVGCGACPQLGSQATDDLAARIWARKQALFAALPDDALHVVAPSRWLAGCARRGLLRRFPLSVIPYAVDTDRFAPRDRAAARARLGIAASAFVILFVATSIDNGRKGLGQLIAALADRPSADRPLLLTVGRGARHDVPPPHRHLGLIEDDAFLAEIYSAADVMVAPSTQDNLPMTVLESLACGTPVVAFDSGGLTDLVHAGRTGMLVRAADTRALGDALFALSREPAAAARMRAPCRAAAVAERSLERQASRHLDLYRRLAEERG